MKLRSLFCGLFVLAAAVACKQDEPVEEAPKLDVSKTSVELAAKAGSASFDVTSNQAWTASADADWVSLEPASGAASEKAVTVKVTAEENTAETARTAKVTVKAGELTKTVTVTQAAAEATEPEPEPEQTTWGLIGMFTDNQWSTDVPMTKEGDWYVAKAAPFTELTFKIRGNGTWNDETNIGVAPGTEKALVNAKIDVVTAKSVKENGGDDAKDIKLNGVVAAYDVYFSVENMEVYVMEAGSKPGEKDPVPAEPKDVTYTVVGTLNNINWNNNAPEGLMTKDGNYHVAKNVPFVTAATLYGGAEQFEFKIVETGTWDGYGVATGTAAAAANTEIALIVSGDNIPVVAEEGNYDVYFDKENAKVWVMTPGLKPGEKPAEPVEPVTTGVIWENDGTVGAANWDNTYRFSIVGGDANDECQAEIPADIWAGMKVAPFCVNVQPAPDAEYWQVRVVTGWWSDQWPETNLTDGAEYDIRSTTEGMVANEDGTYTFEVDLKGHTLAEAMDQKHILFTGANFIINKIYFGTANEGGNEGGEDTFDGEMLTLYYAAEQYDQYKQAIVLAGTSGVTATQDPETYKTVYSGTGKILNLTMHAEKGDAGVYVPAGEYVAGPDTNSPFTWQVTGGMDMGDYGYMYWGTYITDVVDGVSTIVELTEGTCTVEVEGENYILTFESGDYKLRYTGPLTPLVVPAE